jgi:type I restriction enzyme S subunit
MADYLPLSEITEVITKGTTPSTLGGGFVPSGINFVKVESISERGVILRDKLAFIDEATHLKLARSILKKDDILFSIAGAIGRTTRIAESDLPANTNQALAIIRVAQDKASVDYVHQCVQGDEFIKTCTDRSVKSAQANVSLGSMAKARLYLPPLAEQRRIAEILRTWDEAIETAEAELKAKQERKRWLMDKLLGLGAAGFPKSSASGWTAQRLGDILEIRHGKNQREVENPEGRYPILGTGGIIGRTNAFLHDKPSVLIGRKGTIDRPQYMDTPFWTIDTLFYTSISDRAIPRFIFYVFCTVNWQQYNAATGVPSLAASTIESIKIQLPPLAEQRKITDILQAVDADMEVINCRIESLRTQKRGLMQKLLTREVRVVA